MGNWACTEGHQVMLPSDRSELDKERRLGGSDLDRSLVKKVTGES